MEQNKCLILALSGKSLKTQLWTVSKLVSRLLAFLEI